MTDKYLFRDLNNQEVMEFKQWAHNNYVIGSPISTVWHPVVVEECNRMNLHNNNLKEKNNEDQ